jgi:3-hydroxybutyryl-CoA dehydratase
MSETPAEFSYADLIVGKSASFEVSITDELVERFAELSGDQNPLHTDEAYAAKTKFGHRIPHGMIAGALFSRLVGMYLPGKYGLYLSQTLRFHSPLTLRGIVTVRGEVSHKSDPSQTVGIKTIVEDKVDNKMLVSGEALVQLLQ